MSTRRVVVTGVGLTSPIGHSFDDVSLALQNQQHGIRRCEEWAKVEGLETRLAAPASGVVLDYPRKRVRTMGRVAKLAVFATSAAVEDAGLDEACLKSGRTGLAYGSTHGSSSEFSGMGSLFAGTSLAGFTGSTYLKIMSHTCAANLAQYYGIRGRIIPAISACTSASQSIGYAYEAVKYGMQDMMLCGGAEELHVSHAAVFDIMYSTSVKFNDQPDLTPRPFDSRRDGLVVGEGAGTLVLESYESAKARGAHIYAEIVGFGTNCDGTHVTSPSPEGMSGAMGLSMQDAGVGVDDLDYVNAHGTGTIVGDIAESRATLETLGDKVPISSTKSYTGHTLGACGAIESIFCMAMMRDAFLAPCRNLDEVDPKCARVNYLTGETVAAKPSLMMNNNFAFGGINTSLIFRKI